MIPISLHPEPAHFDATVRTPGRSFLVKIPNPTDKQWKGKEYWQRSLPDMRALYGKVCAYSACWIPHSTGSHSVDHFVSKSSSPDLAYEWINFRYVSSRFNSRKGVQKIIDPITLNGDSFILDFTTFFIHANTAVLTGPRLTLALDTIRILKLNDDDELVSERMGFYEEYKNNHIDFHYLNRNAPFIAHELLRQGLN